MDRLRENNIAMLVSAINFLLRDEVFDNLDQVCYYFDKDRKQLEAKIATGGFHYDEKQKRFW